MDLRPDPDPETRPRRVAVIWSRFGPYHLARLRGAAEAMRNDRIIGVEIASDDRDYAWDLAPGADGFERVTVFPDTNYHDLSRVRLVAGVRAALDRVRPHALAINGWSVPEALAALSWARQNRALAILMSESMADGKRRWWKETVKGVVVRQFDSALVGGRPHAAYLERLGFPAERIRLGYDAIDNAYFETESDRARRSGEALRRELGLPREYFFACTRFLPRKNIDGLLRAYAKYRNSVSSPWALVIAGSGREERALRQLATELSLSGSVVWPGFIQYPALPAYFGLASAFVHPAKAEAWGLVVNEAAASALPLLVARPVGAASELVKEGETGFLFDPHDDADIARALEKIARLSAGTRTLMGHNARTLVAGWGPARFGGQLAQLAQQSSRSATQ